MYTKCTYDFSSQEFAISISTMLTNLFEFICIQVCVGFKTSAQCATPTFYIIYTTLQLEYTCLLLQWLPAMCSLTMATYTPR